MPRLIDLYAEHGQSPWLDNLRRDWLVDGQLSRRVHEGVRGVTSNPTIFQKAMIGSDAYDAQLKSLLAGGSSMRTAIAATISRPGIRSSSQRGMAVLPVGKSAGGAARRRADAGRV